MQAYSDFTEVVKFFPSDLRNQITYSLWSEVLKKFDVLRYISEESIQKLIKNQVF